MPEPSRLAGALELAAGAEPRLGEGWLDQPSLIERTVVRRQLTEVESPEQHPEAFASPDGLDDTGVVCALAQTLEGHTELARQRAAAVDDL